MEFNSKEASQAQSTPEPARILIVDDDPLFMDMATLNLQPLGVELVPAYSVKHALSLCETKRFCLVISDVCLPGENGNDIADAIHSDASSEAVNKKTPIIFVTGSESDVQSIDRGYESGAVDYLLKPLDFKQLRAKARVFIELFQLQQEKLVKERLARQQVEADSLALQRFLDDLRSGKVDTLISHGPDKKTIKLMDQLVLEQNEQLTEQLTKVNASLQGFNQVLSHDLNQPLRTLLSFTDYLSEDIENKQFDKVDKDITLIKQAAKQMQTLVSDLSRFAHLGRQVFKRAAVDLSVCIDQAQISLHNTIDQAQASIVCDDTFPLVLGDEAHLARVFQNLIHNSIKFAQPGVKPSIEIRVSEVQHQWVKITYEDNGVGIDPSLHYALFKPFTRFASQQSVEGVGLGLSIVKSVLAMQQSHIQLEPTEAGAKFSITFMRADQDNAQTCSVEPKSLGLTE